MSLAHKVLGLLALSGFASAAIHTWPNSQLDELESLLFDRHGYRERDVLAAGVTPCTSFSFGALQDRSNVADWIRTAYHDAATHDTEKGTGGLDGSIRFEMNRPENLGTGVMNALRHLTMGMNRYVGIADLIALGLSVSVEECGGPRVPFRGGRIDATEEDKSGFNVPEPHQSLQSHTANFARQGFNQTDMIALVACGHSFGGVQHSVFPGTVPLPQGANYDFQATFDSTPFTFDHKIATEYIDGTTKNPLAAGHNDTTNSDKRIFSSDGNVTMRAFANSPDLFRQRCSEMFARMAETVPKNVKLTDIIEPLPVKPDSVLLTYMGDGSLRLTGQVRFWDQAESKSRDIKLHWTDRDGKQESSYTDVLDHNKNMVATSKNDGDVTSLWYSFGKKNHTDLKEDKGISKFWFEVDEGDGSKSRVEDQKGVGFVIQDKVMVANSTCISSTLHARVDIAVRSDLNASRVYLEYDALVGAHGYGAKAKRGGGGQGEVAFFVVVKTLDAKRVETQKNGSAYTIYSVDLPQNAVSSTMSRAVNIAADNDGEKIITSSFAPFTIFSHNLCSGTPDSSSSITPSQGTVSTPTQVDSNAAPTQVVPNSGVAFMRTEVIMWALWWAVGGAWILL